MELSGNTITLTRAHVYGGHEEAEKIADVAGQPVQELLNAHVEAARRACGQTACDLYAKSEYTTDSHWEEHPMGGPEQEVKDPIMVITMGCGNSCEGCSENAEALTGHVSSIFETCFEAVAGTAELVSAIKAGKEAKIREIEAEADKAAKQARDELFGAAREKISPQEHSDAEAEATVKAVTA